jgi:transcriptional regulator GlxA family with amidase domain
VKATFRNAGASYLIDLEHRAHMHPLVHAAQDLVEKILIVSGPLKQLQRRCTPALVISRGCSGSMPESPRAYIAKLRAAAAAGYLRQTGLSLEQVASAVGFSSPEHMRRTCMRVGPEFPLQSRRRAA